MKDARHGQEVRVVLLDDEIGDPRMIGRVGVVVRHIVNDHGAKPSDPLLLIAFDRAPNGRFARHRDAFWESECEPHGGS